ncbi:class I SAM-dependent methyltransferase [Clostridium sp. UBA4548]|uniref:class I SAM-dependent methyltransferase n=1 Tax=Clostridium sp. UBA4548 TaxID=1946361 RepID=UPI0025C1D40B|nr:class I SAM-dependent methyltransferase [Clostridium sp. UBA4548]
MKGTKDFYNKTASEWANKWYKDESMVPYLMEFINYLPQNPRVLDLCCGAGYESMRLENLGAEVIGLDFCEESIKIAKKLNPHIKFVVEDMLNDYSYVGKFHGCAVIAGLIHLPDHKLSKAFEEVYKVINDDGFLFVAVKDGIGKSEKSSYTTIEGEEYDRDFYFHTLEELKLYSSKKFDFEKEILLDKDSLWKYYIFRKCIPITT